MSNDNVNTLAKIGCGILLGLILVPVSCVGMTGALVATGASVEKAAATERANSLKLGEPKLKVNVDRFTGKASWAIPVTNQGKTPMSVTAHADFLDADGLVVVQDILFGEFVEAGATRELTGMRLVRPDEAAQIHSIRITVN